MLRINSNSRNIKSIKRYYCVGNAQMESEVDSFVLIPGITSYNGIYQSNGNSLNFVERGQMVNTMVIEFTNESELERFFIQLQREIKLNQISGIDSIEKDKL